MHRTPNDSFSLREVIIGSASGPMSRHCSILCLANGSNPGQLARLKFLATFANWNKMDESGSFLTLTKNYKKQLDQIKKRHTNEKFSGWPSK